MNIRQCGPSRYPFEYINQFATRTKRYIDGIFTVSLGYTSGISLKDVISQEGTFYGMYPTTVLDLDGNVRPLLSRSSKTSKDQVSTSWI